MLAPTSPDEPNNIAFEFIPYPSFYATDDSRSFDYSQIYDPEKLPGFVHYEREEIKRGTSTAAVLVGLGAFLFLAFVVVVIAIAIYVLHKKRNSSSRLSDQGIDTGYDRSEATGIRNTWLNRMRELVEKIGLNNRQNNYNRDNSIVYDRNLDGDVGDCPRDEGSYNYANHGILVMSSKRAFPGTVDDGLAKGVEEGIPDKDLINKTTGTVIKDSRRISLTQISTPQDAAQENVS